MPSFRDILTTEDMDAAFQYLRAKSQDANDLRPNVAASGPLNLGKWRVAKGSPVIDAWRFEDIYFPNQNNGWIVNWKGQVFKSDDGGENWRPQARLKGALRSVRFMDSKIGIIGSIDDAGIFRTEDGGETWVELKAGEKFFQGVCGLSHFGKSFFGVGRFDKDSNFYKSTDKGITWIKKDLRHLATSLVDVHFVNHRVGFVTGHGAKPGQGAVILRTDDGGENFRVAYATNDAIDFHVWKLNFINKKVIVGSIWTNDKRSAAYMIRSEDGGATWTRQLVSKDYFYVEGIGFLNATVGWMGGGKGLYETRDAGKTWTFLDFGHSVNRFFRVGSKVFAAGKGVYIYEN